MSSVAETAVHEEQHSDVIGAKLGMWLFLFTELLLFGGMFILYAAYRAKHQHEFFLSSAELNMPIGTLNTVLLLTSSLTVALSIEALRRGSLKVSKVFLLATIVMGFGFLVNKFFEWSAKIHHGIYPNSPELLKASAGEQLFFSLYYVMTGLHGLHVLVGVLVLAWIYTLIQKNPIDSRNLIKLENGGLYWHLVDVIWIFLFPLFYLIS